MNEKFKGGIVPIAIVSLFIFVAILANFSLLRNRSGDNSALTGAVINSQNSGTNTDWQKMTIRSKNEWDKGEMGGESEQFMRSIRGAPSDPNVVYAGHDVGGMWKSSDAGETWKQCLSKNLPVLGVASVDVDPVNPKKLFIIASPRWNKLVGGLGGVYVSEDGCESFIRRVLPLTVSSDITYKFYQKAIAYDPTSIPPSGAMVWYAGTAIGGLHRSVDGGFTWTSSLGLEQSINNNVVVEGEPLKTNP